MTPPESPATPRLGAKESSSSKNTTQGAADRALAKTEICEIQTDSSILLIKVFTFSNILFTLSDIHVK